MLYAYLESSIGPLLISGEEHAIHRITFPRDGKAARPEAGWQQTENPRGSLAQAIRELNEYFAGTRTNFDFSIAPKGTPFQLSVWQALSEIPFGSTISYGELARRVGNPNASRAVGTANGSNRLPIVIPCHRVINASGTIGGFSGGVPVKEKLLALEQSVLRAKGIRGRRAVQQALPLR